MLESLTPSEFDRWRAFSIVEGWGDEWLQAGTVAAACHNAMVQMAAAAAGVRPDERDLKDAEDFMPKPESEQRDKGPQVLSGSQSRRRAEMLYG